MQVLLDQIRAVANAGLYYAALFPALSLPDICGALEAPNGVATPSRYAKWFDRNLGSQYEGFLSGKDCYLFRCSLLHQGRARPPGGRLSRILFLEPGPVFMHKVVINDALNIDVRTFCSDMTGAVEAWLPQASSQPHFAANLGKYVTRYPHGLRPYILGVPVFA
jgi:hypothetical protein